MSCNPLACLRPLRCPSCDPLPSHGPPSKIQFRRCPLKPPLRIKSVSTKVSEAKFATLEEHVCANGLTDALGVVRDVLLSAPAEPGAEGSEIVLARTAGPAVAVPQSPLPGGTGSADGDSHSGKFSTTRCTCIADQSPPLLW